jgi:flavin reductase (DIM6/NTAB) family NADH-FMN oxidoreductase RutF
VDQQAFRTAMGQLPSGVTVVTTILDDDAYGMTVSSFTSLSLDPTLVLVCLTRTSQGLQILQNSGVFTVNVLAQHQQSASAWFADRDRPFGAAAFAGFRHREGVNGCPRLDGSAAVFDCTVYAAHNGGDHVIVVGEVLAMDVRPDHEPLVFHRGGYRVLSDADALEPASRQPRPALRVVPPVSA